MSCVKHTPVSDLQGPYQFTRAGADGLASLRGLPDGAYLVTALSEIPAALAQTAAWFESLAAAASPIDVRDGRQASVTLTVGR